MAEERRTRGLTGRNLRVVLAVAVVPISIAAGYYAPRAHDALTMGKSAASIAKQLECTGFKQDPSRTTIYLHHDAGSCRFRGTTLRITTFDRDSDRLAYDQTLRVVEANNTKAKGGVYASGAGWNIVDANGFTPAVTRAAASKLGGATYSWPTLPRKSPAPAGPSASAAAKP
jgi:hypothetical protein